MNLDGNALRTIGRYPDPGPGKPGYQAPPHLEHGPERDQEEEDY